MNVNTEFLNEILAYKIHKYIFKLYVTTQADYDLGARIIQLEKNQYNSSYYQAKKEIMTRS